MAAAARPYWTGFLKLSLVTIGVRLYTATSERDRVRFHQIHEPSGERVRQQLIVPGLGPVERDEIVKGYEYQKGQYVTVEPDDLKRLKLETTDTIDITQFVDEIDPIYFDAPYYLVPDGSVAEEGYRVIREALRETGKIAIGQVVISGQERIVAIRPLGRGLLGNSLHYQDEIRKPEDFFGTIGEDSADEDQLAIMDQIIKRKTRPFEADKFVDHYQAAVRELINEKLKGKLPEKAPDRNASPSRRRSPPRAARKSPRRADSAACCCRSKAVAAGPLRPERNARPRPKRRSGAAKPPSSPAPGREHRHDREGHRRG